MEVNSILTNATKFINFLNKSPTPFHVVESARLILRDAGFSELKLSEPWKTNKLGKYFVTKNESTLLAFVIGGQYENGNGFSIVGAHTDSPCLKLKLVSKRIKQGYLQAGVECYGGGIWHTWFDRDLTIAGRVLLNKNGKIQHKLVHIDKPILRIPNLAIHLNRETNEKFSPNKESHLVPILATVAQEKLLLSKTDSKENEKTSSDESSGDKRLVDKHHSLLIDLICKELNCNPEEINDFELLLVDTQKAQIGGILDEFIFGARLDNQIGAYCALKGLIESCSIKSDLESESGVRIAAIYDHEEVGSESTQGAASALTEQILRRLTDPSSFEIAMSRSFLISADQAHAVHPNYAEHHEEHHRPSMHGGVVLKYNGNQRYATNSVSASILRESAKLVQVPIQDFMVKNDSACGSTIGPLMATKLGITTVDIGTPQLSMHSIRETGSTKSITQLTSLLGSFFRNYTKIRTLYSDFL